MGQPPQSTQGSETPTRAQQAMAAVVAIWVGALVALVPGISTSSGPTIAASLIVLATAPVVLLILLGNAAVKKRRAQPPKGEQVFSPAA